MIHPSILRRSNRYTDVNIEISKYTFLIISYKTKCGITVTFYLKYPYFKPLPNNALLHHAWTFPLEAPINPFLLYTTIYLYKKIHLFKFLSLSNSYRKQRFSFSLHCSYRNGLVPPPPPPVAIGYAPAPIIGCCGGIPPIATGICPYIEGGGAPIIGAGAPIAGGGAPIPIPPWGGSIGAGSIVAPTGWVEKPPVVGGLFCIWLRGTLLGGATPNGLLATGWLGIVMANGFFVSMATRIRQIKYTCKLLTYFRASIEKIFIYMYTGGHNMSADFRLSNIMLPYFKICF